MIFFIFFILVAINYLTLFYLTIRLITYERKLTRGSILVGHAHIVSYKIFRYHILLNVDIGSEMREQTHEKRKI